MFSASDMHYDIAIVTVSSEKIFDACLRSVKCAMDATSLRTCFILVDNGSKTFSAHEMVKAIIPDAMVILRDQNYGFGASCNRGANVVDAKYYFFLNPDTEIKTENVLDALYLFAQHTPKIGIIAPRIQHFSGEHQETHRRFPRWYMPIVQRTGIAKTAFGRAYADEFLMREVILRTPKMIDWAQGSALFVAGDLFRTLKGFDERFWMYFEDIDLCRRAWEAYRPVYYFPDVIIRHAHGKASAVPGNYFKHLVLNRPLRAHIASWLKYVAKWHDVVPRAVATRKMR